jgi:hypothetical protein
VRSFGDVLDLYALSGEEVVAETADFATAAYRQDGLPVLICALDEEDDLPVTLAALARSSVPVQPYVVDNGSVDRTADFAKAMGAEVLYDDRPAKMYALATGLGHMAIEQGREHMLLTDADTVVPKKWGELMIRNLIATGELAMVTGTTAFHGRGEDQTYRITNCVRTTAILFDYYYNLARKSPAKACGANMALSADGTYMQTIIADFDYNTVIRDDDHLSELALKHGLVGRRLGDPRVIALTRGDRMPDLATTLKAWRDLEYRDGSLYQDRFDRVNAS